MGSRLSEVVTGLAGAKEVKMVQVPRKKMSEIEKLEAELTDIEKKLSLL